jgi:hypothetical protein
MSIASRNEEFAWAQWGKNLSKEKIISQLSACEVTPVVSLDTDNLSVSLWREWRTLRNMSSSLVITHWSIINQTIFIIICLLVIWKTVLLSGYSAMNPGCSFVFEWRYFLGVWKNTKIFILRGVPLCPYSYCLLKLGLYLLTCIKRWRWRSSVAAFVLQLLFSQLWDRICPILIVAVTDKALITVLVDRENGPYYCLLG